MSQDKENRDRRNYVSRMYPGLAWQEKVANWPTDRITAVYLRFIRDSQKPKPETPEELERDIREDQDDQDDQDDQLELF
jgi:hypothetical protein